MTSPSKMGDKDTIQILQESILHLCRTNSFNLRGKVEIDGIVCISSESSEQQIVVKVHELFHNDADADMVGSASTLNPVLRRIEPLNPVGTSGHKSSRKRTHTKKVVQDTEHNSIDNRKYVKKARLSDKNCEEYYINEMMVKVEPGYSTEEPNCGLLDVIRRGAEGDDGGDSAVELPSWMSASYQSRSDTEEGSADKSEMIDATYLFPVAKEHTSSDHLSSTPRVSASSPNLSPKKPNTKQKGAFPCPYCDKIFGWHRTLTRHMNTHMDNRPYVCKYCSKAFHRRDFLRYHVVTHVEPEPHKCGVCNKRFSLRKSTLSHMKKFHAVLDHQACSLCFTVFSATEITAHMDGHDTENLPLLSCSDCTYKSKSRFQMIEHSMQHFPSILSPSTMRVDGTPSSEVEWAIPRLSPVPSESMTEILSDSPPTLQQQHID